MDALGTKLQKFSFRKSSMLIEQYFEGSFVVLGVSYLNKLDAVTKGIKQFSNPQALSSVLAALGTL